MKKMYAAVAMLLTAVLITVLPGCGNTVPDASKKETVVTVWSNSSHSKVFVTNMVEKFNSGEGKTLGIRINYQVKSDMDQVAEMAYISDQAPDILQGIGSIDKFAQAGYITSYDEVPEFKDMIAHYRDLGLLLNRRNVFDGKIYGLPFGITTFGMVYNKDMFKAAGIVDEKGEAKPPETWDEVVQDAKLLTNESKQEYGIIFPGKWGGWFGQDINSPACASGGYMDGYNPNTGEFDFQVIGEIMKKLMQIKENGSYVPGVEGLDNDPARARFASGGIGMKFAGSFDYGVYTDQFPAKINWGVATFPVLDKANRHKAFGSYNPSNSVISAKALNEKREQIISVVKFFQSDDYLVESYKAGMTIPLEWDKVKDVQIDSKMENWKGFASLVQSSTVTWPSAIPVDTTGLLTIDKVWLEKIWTGAVPVSGIDAQMEQTAHQYNEAVKDYLKNHPDVSLSLYLDKNWTY